MCGIVGFLSTGSFKSLQATLPEAISRLTHRGPDDSGFFFDPEAGIGLGHRRLSVIDLSAAGRQPMASDDGSVRIVYNGEVYNFEEIRVILEGYGHHFKSDSDTEVILKAYLQWGIDCLKRFVGMFAIALWDSRKQCLFLARDRLGIKPLYYHFSRGRLLFASELKALMAFKSFERDIDPKSIPLFFHYQYVPAPRTIFRNTYKLLPGHHLIYNGNDLRSCRYWTLPDRPEHAGQSSPSEEERLEELDDLLTRAVSDRLVSDVPLGALLSGGIDSSVVVALMQKVSTTPTRTFSIGFRDKGYNEVPWASKVARHLGTDHTEFYVTPRDAMEVIPKLPDMYDEPFADTSSLPTFLVCRLARSQVTVVLSGDGGDEQFSGYVRYWSTKAMVENCRHLPTWVKRGLAVSLGAISTHWVEKNYFRWYRFFPRRFRVANFPDKWQKLVAMMGQDSVSDIYRTTICLWHVDEIVALTGTQLSDSTYDEIFLNTEGWPILHRLMRVDQKTYLPDAMLTKVDRASMAVSLEVRVPLLDHRVMEYTSKLPDSLKYRNGAGKYLLRRLLARYVPTELFERPKMGFGVPIDRWFRNELKTLLLDYLSPERLRRQGFFDHAIGWLR
ncbi:MAG: asparagine synthase (glutamine-hydrolyzing) [Deltaproteobacteria bacterium]|nr:asparagine synthase (glutamine-hydrolyzing) [Deltaproteobacteria bacterium]